MELRLQQVFPVLMLTLLTAGSLWLERATREPEQDPTVDLNSGPDIIVEQMALTRFDINGRPHYYLDAREMRHLPGEAHATLAAPVVHLVREDMDMRWSANDAEVRDDGTRVVMTGDVRGQRSVPGEADMHFRSANLTVWPDVESAKSSTPVTITQAGATARGDRMVADNVFGNTTLIGQAQMHLPAKRKPE